VRNRGRKKKTENVTPAEKTATKPQATAATPKVAARPVIPSISIKQAISGKPEPKTAHIVQPEQPPPVEAPADHAVTNPVSFEKKPITQENLISAWNSFADTIKDDTRIFSTLTSHSPALEDETKIIFAISNSLQKEPLQKIQPKLLQYLQTAFGNETIEIEIVLSEKNENSKIFTAEEKFAQMNSKNPALMTFKQQFNLDFE